MIRQDLSTVWCELTSSVHSNDENEEDNSISKSPQEGKSPSGGREKEILLCFRPLIKGSNVSEQFRFPMKTKSDSNENKVSDSNSDDVAQKHRPVKKRPFISRDSTFTSEQSSEKKHKGHKCQSQKQK